MYMQKCIFGKMNRGYLTLLKTNQRGGQEIQTVLSGFLAEERLPTLARQRQICQSVSWRLRKKGRPRCQGEENIQHLLMMMLKKKLSNQQREKYRYTVCIKENLWSF
ncbi:MAG: hypothetical protein D3919_15740 [Candidatus Electrothrix sp. AW5]|nr:hypothetical protein [Candidatus Electrothrix gigas]